VAPPPPEFGRKALGLEQNRILKIGAFLKLFK